MDFILQLLVKLFIILAILPLHEFAHAFAAKKMGDKSAEMTGRLTLNPLKHLDIFGALLMLLVGFGWAKPVPVNPDNFKIKNKKLGMAVVAVAGPASNLVAALVGVIVLRALIAFSLPYDILLPISDVLVTFIWINITLAVFNLIPVPPLDGSKVLFAFLPDKWIWKIERFTQYSFILLFILIYFLGSAGFITTISSSIADLMIDIVDKLFVMIGL